MKEETQPTVAKATKSAIDAEQAAADERVKAAEAQAEAAANAAKAQREFNEKAYQESIKGQVLPSSVKTEQGGD